MRKLAAQILLVLYLPSLVLAADTTHYIRTDCTFSGDGTTSSCAASGGAAGAWKTCQQAITGEVAAQANLTTRGGNLILDAAGATADGTCSLTGFTGLDATHMPILYVSPANRHNGRWDTAHYRLTSANGGGTLITNSLLYEVDGVEAVTTGSGSGAYAGLRNDATTTGAFIHNSIFRLNNTCNTGGGGQCNAVYIQPGVSGLTLKFVNNICYFESGITTSANVPCHLRGADTGTGEVDTFYNNTCFSNVTGQVCYQFGANGAADTRHMKNNIAQGTATGYGTSGSFTTDTDHSGNLSADTTSIDVGGRSKTVTFTSTTNGSEDFRITSGDASAKDLGTNLSADGTYAFSTDAVNVSRPQGAAWDIGALEYVASGKLIGHNATSGEGGTFNSSGSPMNGGAQ